MYDACDPHGHGEYSMGENPRDTQENRNSLQCWGCGGDYLIKYRPHRSGNEGQVHNTQEVENVGQEVRTIPKICAVLEDHQAGHNLIVLEVEGDIAKQIVFVLIDP